MIERALITLILVVVGILVYRLWKGYQLQRLSEVGYLANFVSGSPAVVLFTADFCAPCKYQQQPALVRLTQEMPQVQVIEVDVQAEPEVARQWGVMSLPTTFILDRAGQPRDVNYGVTSTEILKHQLEAIS